jgi:hypothetical protein
VWPGIQYGVTGEGCRISTGGTIRLSALLRAATAAAIPRYPAGTGLDALFCNASRNGSSHPSYCRHHAARSVAIDEPGVFAAECPRPLFSA